MQTDRRCAAHEYCGTGVFADSRGEVSIRGICDIAVHRTTTTELSTSVLQRFGRTRCRDQCRSRSCPFVRFAYDLDCVVFAFGS